MDQFIFDKHSSSRVERISNLRPIVNTLQIENIDEVVKGKKIKTLHQLQEKYNKKPIEVTSSTRGCFGVLLERNLTEKDLQFGEDVEIWTLSDFRRSTSHHQTQAFLFVAGEILTSVFRKRSDENLCGQIVFLNGLSILPGMTYNDFKNKYSRKKKNKLSLAMSIFRPKDLVFVGKCADYGRCQFSSDKFGLCNDPVNMGRNALSTHLLMQSKKKKKQKMKTYCHIHSFMRMSEGAQRMDISQPIGPTTVSRVKPTYVYENAVYTYLNRNVFINPKGFRKLKRINRSKKVKEKKKAKQVDFFENQLPEKLSRGQKMIMFQKRKAQRERMEDLLRKKNDGASNLEVKKRAMEIVADGILAPRIARGVKRKRTMVFELSDDEESEEEEGKNTSTQPPLKKRKLD